MQQCECKATKHGNHPGIACNKPVTAVDAYCSECQDQTTKERAVTVPDLRSYQPR